jgi:hypothetical protein
MSFQAKRELLAQTAPRYQLASHSQKSIILDEFVAATTYDRKYAIRLLTHPVAPPAPMRRPRAPRYGPAVQEALRIAWAASNGICAKRLVPFLPELVPTLERHGHLILTDEVRTQLLTLSPATADRLLRPVRNAAQPHGISTTKRGTLLKHHIPIRTFTDWNDTHVGFMEADLVAHCGTHTEGAFLHTLVLTDIASGWTECLPLLHRSHDAVIQALDRVRQLLPFPLLGFDTDNGSEFLNTELLAYCEREQITFTRGRVGKKNDQCFVEQKNGAIVRQLIGYDRFEGEAAYRQLTEVYRAVRLYVNFFQPSMKLLHKRREGSSVYRKYDTAQTPWQRLQAQGTLAVDVQARLEAIYQALDPVRLLSQLATLQQSLWTHAVLPATERTPSPPPPIHFTLQPGTAEGANVSTSGIVALPAVLDPAQPPTKRKYRRTKPGGGPRTYRTRPDPFADVWAEACTWLAANPERTAKSIFVELQQRYPGRFPDVQLRTLQRRVAEWRAHTILAFDAQWLQEELLVGQVVPPMLRAIHESDAARVDAIAA